jgi:hypothetical protein
MVIGDKEMQSHTFKLEGREEIAEITVEDIIKKFERENKI